MFSKQNLLATVAATIAMFILGYLIWGMALMSFFEEHSIVDVMKSDEEMSLGMIFLGNLATAFALSTLYGKWARGHHSAAQGFQFGAWVGFLIGVGMGLVWLGTSNFMDMTGHIAEAIVDILYYGVTGAIIALIYTASAPKAAA
ncbi:hypothetical protein ACT6NV_08300 [Robiginitalea sp. IMCC44478]|uniref:hypothetical protein n=1 Tax=Robiginitalea sp. IMCC44478 TaxID=3459122 RepID=UPI00404272FF